MNRYLSKVTWKGLMIAVLVVAVGLGAGVAVLWTSGDVKADSGLSPGFMKGTNPSKPDPKMIEEGKKIYSASVSGATGWMGRVMALAPIGSGRVRATSTRAPSRSGIRRAESYRCLIPRSRLLVRMTCLILLPTDCRVRLCLLGMAF